jgi:hypothetical protein
MNSSPSSAYLRPSRNVFRTISRISSFQHLHRSSTSTPFLFHQTSSPSILSTMSIRPLLRPPLSLRFLRPFSTTIRRPAPASIPYIQSCPSPTCACAPTPPDLDIDRKTPLLNTMASYSQQVVICTGKDDWSSRIEDEKTGSGEFIRGLKGVVGKGGEAFDVS